MMNRVTLQMIVMISLDLLNGCFGLRFQPVDATHS